MNPYPRHPAPLYLVNLDKPAPFRGRVLEPATYVCDHVTLSLLTAYAIPEHVRTLDSSTAPFLDTTLIMPGVFGDLLMLTTLDLNSGDQVACFPEYATILEGVVDTVDLPVKYDRTRNYVNLSHLTERPEVVGQPFTDGLRAMGFENVEDRVRYRITGSESETAKQRFPRQRLATRIAIQPYASAACRTYPHMGELLAEIDKRFDPIPEILILCDSELKVPEAVKHRVFQTAGTCHSIRESAAAMLATCDALICPDSVFQHIAGANNLPTVALFGPFHWSERVLASTTRGLQGNAPCAPCRHHAGSANGASHPSDSRCTIPTTGFCAAMAAITPERIVTELKKLLEGGES